MKRSIFLLTFVSLSISADITPTKGKGMSKARVDATFHFYATPENAKVPTGTYEMGGTFDPSTRALDLKGVSWVKRPENYEMVPLKGKINEDGSKFIGRIQFEGCKEFTLLRISREGSSPISGKWQGGYVCSQGVTGLTLTLK